MKKNMQMLVVIGLLAVLLLGGGTGFFFATQDLGYSTAFQGPKPSFKGVKVGSAKSALSGTTINFDADDSNTGVPNIVGEMTSIFVPEESLGSTPTWVPRDWLSRNALLKNPQKTYSWNISGKTYKMEQWVLKWYVSLGAEWTTRAEAGGIAEIMLGSSDRSFYSQTELWFEIDIKPTWYIQGSGTAYFALAKIQLANTVAKTAKDNSGNVIQMDSKMSVVPESQGSILYVYKGLYGGSAVATSESSFEGKLLNPEYFTDRVYCKIGLSNFGCTSWNEFFTVKTKGDVATFDFDITAFVIGEWDVQDIQEIPEDFGRTTKTEQNPSLLDYLNNPKVQALITLLAAVGIIVLLLLFAPWVLIAIFAMFTGRRRR